MNHITKSNGRRRICAQKARTKTNCWKTRFCFHCIFYRNERKETEELSRVYIRDSCAVLLCSRSRGLRWPCCHQPPNSWSVQNGCSECSGSQHCHCLQPESVWPGPPGRSNQRRVLEGALLSKQSCSMAGQCAALSWRLTLQAWTSTCLD